MHSSVSIQFSVSLRPVAPRKGRLLLRELALLLLVLAAMFGARESFALTCSPVSAPAAAVNLSSVNFPRDATIGSASPSTSTTIVVQCDADPNNQRDVYFSFTPTPATLASGFNDVYPTNLAGVGVRFTVTSGVETGPNVQPPGCDKLAPLPTTLQPPANLPAGNNGAQVWCHNWPGSGTFTYTLTVKAELIKTASIVAGTLSSLPSLTLSSTINNNGGIFSLGTVYSGSASGTLASLACITPDVTVNLGNHLSSEFSGVGSTTSSTSFNIALNSCPSGLNTIQYQIDPVTSIVSGTGNTVVTLNSGSTANRVGVQLLDGNGNPLALSSPITFSGYSSSTGGDYTIPLKARYYQTGTPVGPGSANTSMIFTMTYQ